MIVLDRIDPVERSIEWREAPCDLPGTSSPEAIVERLRLLGVEGPYPRHEPTSYPGADHSWSTDADGLRYRLGLPLARLAPSTVSYYVAAALATLTWFRLEDLLSVHLAIYELAVNVHDHGRPLDEARSRLEIDIRVSIGGIDVALTDGCEVFDPNERPRSDVAERVERRANRGYGMTLIERTVGDIDHQYGESGNVVRFSKRTSG